MHTDMRGCDVSWARDFRSVFVDATLLARSGNMSTTAPDVLRTMCTRLASRARKEIRRAVYIARGLPL